MSPSHASETADPSPDHTPAAMAGAEPEPGEVIMFGTGRFLRGFACDLLGRAGDRSVGRASAAVPQPRITMVQSTGRARCEQINAAGGRFTLAVRGLRDGAPVEELREITTVGRCLSAADGWAELLALAARPAMRLIVSNVTEAGLDEPERSADPAREPPTSFLGRLTVLLHERFRVLGDTAEAELVVAPCELVPDNGARVAEGVRTLAERWSWGAGQPDSTGADGSGFAAWLGERVAFVTTLVDRIVTEPTEAERAAFEAEPGRADGLLTIAEPFALWAIERPRDPGLRLIAERVLGPLVGGREHATPGVRLVEDITPVAERKLRLLNGSHTACAAIAVLSGIATVRELLDDEHGRAFLRGVLERQLLPALDRRRPEPAGVQENREFAAAVLERFANPFLDHRWRDIAAESASKAEHRLVPTELEDLDARDHGRAGATAADSPIGIGLAGILLLHQPGRDTTMVPAVSDRRALQIAAAWAAVGEPTAGDQHRAHRLAEAALERGVFGDTALWSSQQRIGVAASVAGGLLALADPDLTPRFSVGGGFPRLREAVSDRS